MRILGNNAIVEYISEHNKVLAKGLNGLDIIRAEQWESSDYIEKKTDAEDAIKNVDEAIKAYKKSYNTSSERQDELIDRMIHYAREANQSIAEMEDTTKRVEENVNYLETNPQIAIIRHPSAYLDYKVGDTVFLHYMAWEWAEKTEEGYHWIDTDFIFFQIMDDGSFRLRDDLYLGEAVVTEDVVNSFGLVTSLGHRDNLKVKLTHLPPNNKYFEVGDVVVSIDKNNYELDYWGKKYIKLTLDEIAGKITSDKKLLPIAG